MRRVVITGMGLVTPLGIGVDLTWNALIAGQSGVGPITRFDASAYKTRFAAEVPDFDPERFIERKKVREMDRVIQFSVAASGMAWDDAGIGSDLTSADRARMGCIIGIGIGGIETIERTVHTIRDKGPGRVSPYFIPSVISNLGAGQVAIRLGLRGVNYCITSACASGAHAIGEAFRWIQRGGADVMVVGGAEAAVCPVGIAGFNAMYALSVRNDDPARASRPWDRDRDGFVAGEGAGILVLEDRDRALSRGAKIYAEVIGYGATDDGYHITQPAPEGEGACRAMSEALADANVAPERVGYINAHGTSTQVGDLQETQAIRQVFGPHADRLAVSSTKSMTGHLLGAAGGIEAAFSALAIQRGVLPPTINLDHPGEGCDLDYIPHTSRLASVDVVLSNSFGFGGTNASLVIARHG